MTRSTALALTLLACLPIVLNALKPLTNDDPVYWCYAAHMAEHPTDPYGFVLFGANDANHTLAPPVVPYYWAAAIRLFGDHAFAWKLAFLPFSLLLVWSLHALFRRFAAGLELPLTALLVLSPSFLPAWNLMLDMPALALGVTALALFFHAVDQSSLGKAALAGLFAGLAMQTKYTALVAPAVMLVYAWLARRPGYGVLAVAVAVAVFASWEGFMALRYGESHFLIHLGQRRGGLLHKQRLLLPLLATLGGVAAGTGLLALAALGRSRRFVLLAAGAVLLGFAVVGVVPEADQTLLHNAGGAARLSLSGLIFGVFGAVMVLITAAVLRRLWHAERPPSAHGARQQVEWFLVLWLGLETTGYFALAPFPAARRVLGVVVVGTLLAGRLASQTCQTVERRRLVGLAVLVSMLLGFGYYAVDVRDSRARAKTAQQAARWIERHDPHPTIWFMGTEGFQFYAERAGMKRLVPGSVMQPGSWYVTEGTFVEDERMRFPDGVPNQVLSVRDALPLRTQLCYYASGTPLEHLSGPRAVVRIYRK